MAGQRGPSNAASSLNISLVIVAVREDPTKVIVFSYTSVICIFKYISEIYYIHVHIQSLSVFLVSFFFILHLFLNCIIMK